jgi:hypothetical protein
MVCAIGVLVIIWQVGNVNILTTAAGKFAPIKKCFSKSTVQKRTCKKIKGANHSPGLVPLKTLHFLEKQQCGRVG